MNEENNAIQHMCASKVYINTAAWAIKEFVELVKAYLAEEYGLRYSRRFLIAPRLYQNQIILRQVQHEGMSIVLLQPEEKRLIDEQTPDKAFFLNHDFGILPAIALRKLLTIIINRFFSAGTAIDKESDQTPFLYYTNQLQKISDYLDSSDLLEEILITSANGRIAWIVGLKELAGYCEQLFAPYVHTDCIRLEIPRMTPTHNIAISDIIEIPIDGSFSSLSFEILTAKLDQYWALTKLASTYLLQDLNSEIAYSLTQEDRRHPKQTFFSSVTQAEAAQMYGVTERTVRNWEKSSDGAPSGYPGRSNRGEMELHAKIYRGEKTNRLYARLANRYDARDYNRQNDIPESDNSTDIAAWNEEQNRKRTGKKPENDFPQ